MIDETNPSAHGPGEHPAEASPSQPEGTTTPAPTPAVSEAVIKFRSCRWRSDPESGDFCTHRDVLPFAGKEGFVADSWCPDCAFYKLRRTPKKRDYNGY